MVDQQAFDLRVNKGMLPTIEVEGHTFYVDIRMDMLRPKDDFLSNGIRFTDIENYFDENRNAYFIPYDAKRHEFREIDYETIKEIPKDLVVVSFPNETLLDPIGWNRKHGFDIKNGLKESGLKMNFKARLSTWGDIYVPEKIKENIKSIKEEPKMESPLVRTSSSQEKKSKGRKM